MQVGCYNCVEVLWVQGYVYSYGIDQYFILCYIWEILCDFGCDFILYYYVVVLSV